MSAQVEYVWKRVAHGKGNGGTGTHGGNSGGTSTGNNGSGGGSQGGSGRGGGSSQTCVSTKNGEM